MQIIHNKSNSVVSVLIQVITLHYVSPEGACASPHAACVAALCHRRPELQVSVSEAMSSFGVAACAMMM